MSVWDWIEIGWLLGLTGLAMITILVINNIIGFAEKTLDRTRERLGELEEQNRRLKELLKAWTKDLDG